MYWLIQKKKEKRKPDRFTFNISIIESQSDGTLFKCNVSQNKKRENSWYHLVMWDGRLKDQIDSISYRLFQISI